jgi:DNA-binding NarL/FixJ family response regulator
MVQKISILAAEPNYLVRKGLEALVFEQADFELKPSAHTITELKEALLIHQPDVVIVDYNHFPEGMDVLKTIGRIAPHSKVLVITDPRRKAEITRALDAGAVSFLLRECDQEEIIEAIYKTSQNQKFLCGRILEHLVNDKADEVSADSSCSGLHITEREIEIIRLVAEGMSNKEVAEKLFLSTHTVTTHRKNIMNKLQVNNTAGLVLYAVRNDLLGSNKFLFS